MVSNFVGRLRPAGPPGPATEGELAGPDGDPTDGLDTSGPAPGPEPAQPVTSVARTTPSTATTRFINPPYSPPHIRLLCWPPAQALGPVGIRAVVDFWGDFIVGDDGDRRPRAAGEPGHCIGPASRRGGSSRWRPSARQPSASGAPSTRDGGPRAVSGVGRTAGSIGKEYP